MDSEPRVRAVRRSAAGVEIELLVPGDLDFFPDHFPRLGLLPGVLQIHWAVRLGREHLGIDGSFRGLRAIKFVNPILADTTPLLVLAHSRNELSFTYRLADQVCSTGRALFAARA